MKSKSKTTWNPTLTLHPAPNPLPNPNLPPPLALGCTQRQSQPETNKATDSASVALVQGEWNHRRSIVNSTEPSVKRKRLASPHATGAAVCRPGTCSVSLPALYVQVPSASRVPSQRQVPSAFKVRLVKEYALTPGDAYLYNEGDLHSPRREGSTRLIRIEGRNVEKIRRLAYEAV